MSPGMDSAIQNKGNECLLNRTKRFSGVLGSFLKNLLCQKDSMVYKKKYNFLFN